MKKRNKGSSSRRVDGEEAVGRVLQRAEKVETGHVSQLRLRSEYSDLHEIIITGGNLQLERLSATASWTTSIDSVFDREFISTVIPQRIFTLVALKKAQYKSCWLA
ncbi:hypothetical protein PAMP_010679 [Pampus punctatissimus]